MLISLNILMLLIMKALLLKYNCPPTEIDINNINRVVPNNYVVDVYTNDGNKLTGSMLKFTND